MAGVVEVGGTDGSHRVEKCLDRWSGIFKGAPVICPLVICLTNP